MKKPRRYLRVLALATAIAAVACGGYGTGTAQATVYFVLDAPLCSSRIPMKFSIDNTVVGIDTFVNLTPSHTTSHAYVTSPGQHVLSGVAVSGGFLFPAKTVTLTDGASYMDSLSTSCS